MTNDGESAHSPFARKGLCALREIEYRRLVDSADLEAVYQLRYAAYRREGFIAENADKRCVDALDNSPNRQVFGLYYDGELISSIRLNIVTRAFPDSPGMLAFPDIVGPMLERGLLMVDPSRFTVSDVGQQRYKALLPYLTLRVATLATVYYRADHTMSVVRPEHAAFYQRVYQSKQLGRQRLYPDVNFPVELYATEPRRVRAGMERRYPFFKASQAERESLFGPALFNLITAGRPPIHYEHYPLADDEAAALRGDRLADAAL